jgi:hypothetical protein
MVCAFGSSLFYFHQIHLSFAPASFSPVWFSRCRQRAPVRSVFPAELVQDFAAAIIFAPKSAPTGISVLLPLLQQGVAFPLGLRFSGPRFSCRLCYQFLVGVLPSVAVLSRSGAAPVKAAA